MNKAKVKLPNFLIIGAPKSGTTTLFNCLNQHPEIFMPEKKEPFYFSFPEKELDYKGIHDVKYFNKMPAIE